MMGLGKDRAQTQWLPWMQAEIAALLEKAGALSSKQVEQGEEAAALKVRPHLLRHSLCVCCSL